jgi:hypothetical protein
MFDLQGWHTMIDHVWTVVCSRAVIDRDSNNVSLQNVIEQLRIQADPLPDGVLPIPLQLATLWARADLEVPARGYVRVTFLSPSSEALIGPFESEIDLIDYRRHRTRADFKGLPLRESGRYVFRVELRIEDQDQWHQVAAIPLEVNFEPPEEAEQDETA